MYTYSFKAQDDIQTIFLDNYKKIGLWDLTIGFLNAKSSI